MATTSNPASAENPVLTKSIASLLTLDEGTLVAMMKMESSQVASQHLGMGKMLFCLEKKKPKKSTLAKYARKVGLGEIDSSAYKCFSAFRMVRDSVEQKPGDKGTIEEEHYDTAKLRWLIVTSQILNVLEKDFADNLDFRTEIREQVAIALRTPDPKKTPEVLQAIYEQLKPKDEEGGGEGEGEGGDQAASMDAMQLAEALVAVLKKNGELAAESTDVAALAAAKQKLPMLRDLLTRAGACLDFMGVILDAKTGAMETAAAEAPAQVEAAAA